MRSCVLAMPLKLAEPEIFMQWCIKLVRSLADLYARVPKILIDMSLENQYTGIKCQVVLA